MKRQCAEQSADSLKMRGAGRCFSNSLNGRKKQRADAVWRCCAQYQGLSLRSARGRGPGAGVRGIGSFVPNCVAISLGVQRVQLVRSHAEILHLFHGSALFSCVAVRKRLIRFSIIHFKKMHDCPTSRMSRVSPPEAKIALFRSLFRGRTDVYPVRFENRTTGKSGYAPACANEWVRGVCNKPRTKCGACSSKRFLPVTDETIRAHLSGKPPGSGGSGGGGGIGGSGGREFVMGVYPMLPDERCFFLATDFDGEAWHHDAGALLETCRRLGIPIALERSRSGNGAHAWFFSRMPSPPRWPGGLVRFC